jgi:hypothetical protein
MQKMKEEQKRQKDLPQFAEEEKNSVKESQSVKLQNETDEGETTPSRKFIERIF